MKITTYTNSTHMTNWDEEDHTHDSIDLALSTDGEHVIFDLARNDSDSLFYMTFEESIRVASELKVFAERYGG